MLGPLADAAAEQGDDASISADGSSADAGPAAAQGAATEADAQAATEGACTGGADQAVLAEAPVPRLSCEGGVCIARNLQIGLSSSTIDESGARSCLADEAPMLKRLSPACRACFLQISLCAPESCVSLLGGASNACLGDGLPSTDFASCNQPPAPTPPCATCQAPCRTAFVRCSGLPETDS